MVFIKLILVLCGKKEIAILSHPSDQQHRKGGLKQELDGIK
jgi:hypothetical protein